MRAMVMGYNLGLLQTKSLLLVHYIYYTAFWVRFGDRQIIWKTAENIVMQSQGDWQTLNKCSYNNDLKDEEGVEAQGQQSSNSEPQRKLQQKH